MKVNKQTTQGNEKKEKEADSKGGQKTKPMETDRILFALEKAKKAKKEDAKKEAEEERRRKEELLARKVKLAKKAKVKAKGRKISEVLSGDGSTHLLLADFMDEIISRKLLGKNEMLELRKLRSKLIANKCLCCRQWRRWTMEKGKRIQFHCARKLRRLLLASSKMLAKSKFCET